MTEGLQTTNHVRDCSTAEQSLSQKSEIFDSSLYTREPRALPRQLNKLEFGGESPLTMRARCSGFRYCPDPLGIVTAEQFDKLEFVGVNDENFIYDWWHYGSWKNRRLSAT